MNAAISAATHLSFEERAQAYLEAVLAASDVLSRDPGDGIFQLVPFEAFRLIPPFALNKGPVDTGPLPGSLQRIAERRDCADFVLAGLQRILLRYANSPLLTSDIREPIAEAVLNFAYWYDQPGIRGMCFHTENHQILFHSCEILAGVLFPDRIFKNSGKTGAWHIEHGTNIALRWMDERIRFGFVEWLSCYYEEDLLALLNIYDFASDPVVRRRAGMLSDVILFEIALHAHHGILGTTHGRTYAEYIKGGQDDPVSAISWLVFGEGAFIDRPNLALTALATSDYRCPELILQIARDPAPEVECRERKGLNVEEAARWGLDPDRQDSQMFFWACQTSRHPLVRPASRRMAEIANDPWLTDFTDEPDTYVDRARDVVESGGAAFDGDPANTALSAANLLLYRTPEYSLSCAQDFRPGKPGYQQHVWQATLDSSAVVFTNHPGTANESSAHTDRPNFWAGNRYLPRAAQHKNVLICIHHVPADDRLPFSHAYFPVAAFDETKLSGNWLFGRKGCAFLALYSQSAARLPEDGIEARADAPDNIWICEMGSAKQYDSFDHFVDAIATSKVSIADLAVAYDSPSLGEVTFGWTGPLTVAENEIALANYPRYDNPYCHAQMGDRQIVIERNGESLIWDFEE